MIIRGRGLNVSPADLVGPRAPEQAEREGDLVAQQGEDVPHAGFPVRGEAPDRRPPDEDGLRAER